MPLHVQMALVSHLSPTALLTLCVLHPIKTCCRRSSCSAVGRSLLQILSKHLACTAAHTRSLFDTTTGPMESSYTLPGIPLRVDYSCYDQARFGACDQAFMRETPEELPEGSDRDRAEGGAGDYRHIRD